MSDIALSIENLSKAFRIQHERGGRSRYKTLREDMIELPKRLWSRLFRHDQSTTEIFWALKDVSFEVKQGEVVGIIGRNGAGKSTLLKILSRITEPTSGRAKIYGRVGSLLEVGTGFHPELTGRENIFLNGAILGMRRAEIRNKFDEIVAFAEIEKFLDTPVKRYSSGMYVRLAFAVAAHLDPEILLVDEVLAVGDADFQKKCLGKMHDVSRAGRTVFFVSHNMAAIKALCLRAILLENGQLVADGEQSATIKRYLSSSPSTASVNLADRKDRGGDGSMRLDSISIVGADDGGVLTSTSKLKITLSYHAGGPIPHPKILIGIYDENEVGIYGLDSEATGGLPDTLPTQGTVTCITGPLHLTAGRCSLNIALFSSGTMADYVQHAAEFDVEPEDFYGTGRIHGREWMIGLIHHRWSLVAD